MWLDRILTKRGQRAFYAVLLCSYVGYGQLPYKAGGMRQETELKGHRGGVRSVLLPDSYMELWG
jgi:hypothetical protein